MKLIPLKEIISMIALVILGLVLLNPFYILMPTMVEMTLYSLLLVITALFVGFVVNEKIQDEREEKHRASAGRTAYLFGLCILIIGISIQTFSHKVVDPWLVITLIVMVIGKVSSRIYTQNFE